jgi:anti-sigma regulatory factor (Ser/Thr protein kinase)
MKQINLSMQNNLKDLAVLMNQASAFLESQSLPETVVYRANLVMEEVLTNVVKYAFEDTAKHEINVELSVNDDDLAIRFEDDGREFDPLAVPLPVTKKSLEDADVGGLGVYLVRKSVSSIEYRRDRSKNVLDTRIRLGSK